MISVADPVGGSTPTPAETASPPLPSALRIGLHNGTWSVATEDRFGWVEVGTGEPLSEAEVCTWTPLVSAAAARSVVGTAALTEDQWAVIEAAVTRGIREHVRAYAIPANGLAGGDAAREARMARSWASVIAPHVMECIRHDLGAGDGDE